MTFSARLSFLFRIRNKEMTDETQATEEVAETTTPDEAEAETPADEEAKETAEDSAE